MLLTAVVRRHYTKSWQQIKPKIFHSYIRKNLLFRINFLLSNIHLRNLSRCCYFNIHIVHTIINYFFKAVYLCAGQDVYVDNGLSFIGENLRHQIYGRRKQCRIADAADKIPYHIRRRFFRNADNSPIIQHTHKKIPAKAVQKCAYRFIHIIFNPISASLKLNGNGFSYFQY